MRKRRHRSAYCPKCGSVQVRKQGKLGTCLEADCKHLARWKEFRDHPMSTKLTLAELQGGRAYVPPIGDHGAVPPTPRYPSGNRSQPLKLK